MLREVRTSPPMPEPEITFEVVTDPARIAESREAHEAFKRNADWLGEHWDDLLPGAFGKCLAVVGQEAFTANSVEEVVALARAAHPDEKGMFVQYVPPPDAPRLHGIRG